MEIVDLKKKPELIPLAWSRYPHWVIWFKDQCLISTFQLSLQGTITLQKSSKDQALILIFTIQEFWTLLLTDLTTSQTIDNSSTAFQKLCYLRKNSIIKPYNNFQKTLLFKKTTPL